MLTDADADAGVDLLPLLRAPRGDRSRAGRSLSRLAGPMARDARAGPDDLGRAERPDALGLACVGREPERRVPAAVLGVDSAGPGFAVVRIEPHLGPLTEIAGRVPHPKGAIEVELKRTRRRARREGDAAGGRHGDLVVEREGVTHCGQGADVNAAGERGVKRTPRMAGYEPRPIRDSRSATLLTSCPCATVRAGGRSCGRSSP